MYADAWQADLCVEQIARWPPSITTFRPFFSHSWNDNTQFRYFCHYRTIPRKNFASIKTFVEEPESRAQCMALEDNVKKFGLRYFGMDDRRQGM